MIEVIGIILSAIAAFAAVFTLIYTIRNSKGCILKRIDKKEGQIRKLEHQLVLRYGINRGSGGPITSLDYKIRKLQREITELKRKL